MDSWIGLCNSVPFSLWTIYYTDRIPLFLWTRPKKWPLSCSKSLCIERDESSIWLAFFVVFRSPWDVVEHRHEDNPFCEFFWCYTQSRQLLLDFVAELQCGESWEDIPLEFHWLTINSVQSSAFWWTFEPRQCVFPCNIWLWVLVHLSKA